jgi:O-antigen/teichoic acid export membrane protein
MYWQKLWINAQQDNYETAVLTLLFLNGISIKDILEINSVRLDIQSGWLESSSSNTYPLVIQSSDALRRLDSIDDERWVETVNQFLNTYPSLTSDANRILSGAIWATNTELQETLAMTGNLTAPILPLRFTFPFSITENLSYGEQSDTAIRARETLQVAADWLQTELDDQPISLIKRLMNILRQGSFVFVLASTAVNGLNLVHNVLMGRLLSPSDYSQLTFIITLQLLIGLFPTVLQTVVARFSARYSAQSNENFLQQLYQDSSRIGWLIGIAVTIILLVLSPIIVTTFKLNDLGIIIPIILTASFFVKAGVERGILQGFDAYYWLTGAYVSEGVTRLVMSVILGYALLSFGRSLEGAIWGLAQSMFVIWFVGWIALRHLTFSNNNAQLDAIEAERSEWMILARATAIALIGQMLITNSDFILVKNFFSPEDAGLYAAISVLGRIVYFGALPLTILLVPMVSRRQALNQSTRPILILLVVGGIGICGLLIFLAAVFAPLILTVLYGDAYTIAAGLLAPYALAASLYTLTNLVITYQLSLGNGREAYLPIVAGGAQIMLVFLFHESLIQVIQIQIILMGGLFFTILWRVLRLKSETTSLPVQLQTG